MFVLLGRDPMSAGLVRLWAERSEKRGENPETVAKARVCADAMEFWATQLGRPVEYFGGDKYLIYDGADSDRHGGPASSNSG